MMSSTQTKLQEPWVDEKCYRAYVPVTKPAMSSIVASSPPAADLCSGLAMVKGIMAAGGVAGYNDWVTKQGAKTTTTAAAATTTTTTTTNVKANKKAVPIAKMLGDANVYTIMVDLGTPLIYTFIDVHVLTGALGWSGSGGAWGFGLSGGEAGGVLTISSDNWADFAAATTSFDIADGGEEVGGVVVAFSDNNGNIIGTAVMAGEVLGAAIGFSGTFSWR